MTRVRKPDPVVSTSETFITNIPIGKKEPPKGEPWVAYMPVTLKSGKRDIVELSGLTELDRDRAICDFVEKNAVAVVAD